MSGRLRLGPGRTGGRHQTATAATSPAPRRKGSSIAVAGAIWVLVVFSTVPDGFVYGAAAQGMPTEGSTMSRIGWLTLLAFGAAVTLSRSGVALRLLRRINPYLLLFVALAAASAVWSIDPMVTVRRSVRMMTIVLDAIALTLVAWRTTRFQTVLRPILTIVLIGSIIFVLAAPQLAIEQVDLAAVAGAWHGLATQKNGLGSLSAIALILWMHAWLNGESRWWWTVLGIAVAGTCLLESRSSTSIVAAAFSILLLLTLLRSPPGLRRYLPYLIVLFVGALLLYSLAVLNLVPGSGLLLSPITMLTGKDQTFSGRTAIWNIMREHIALRPILGSGYGAYWVQVPNSPSMEMLRRLYFYPTEGHNGYLDVVNDLGAVGGLCLLGYLVTFLRQGLRLLAALRPQGVLYLTLLFEQLIANLSESRWFNTLCCEFVIMTIATIAMGRTLLDRQTQSQPQSSGRAASGPPGYPARRAFSRSRTPR